MVALRLDGAIAMMLISRALLPRPPRPAAFVVALIAAAGLLLGPQGAAIASRAPLPAPLVRLPGHVLPALAQATPISESGDPTEEMVLTLVLRRDDKAGFERYLRDVYDPASARHRRFLTQAQITERFGPSRVTYEDMLAFLAAHGLELVAGSDNRLTVSMRGTRIAAERAFAVEIGDYELDGRRFYANDRDPALPPDLARSVASISGLSSLTRPRPQRKAIREASVRIRCWLEVNVITREDPEAQQSSYDLCVLNSEESLLPNQRPIPGIDAEFASSTLGFARAMSSAGLNFNDLDGAGQTVGLVAFDRFELSDVADYLAFTGAPATRIDQVHRVPVAGGAIFGPDQAEVLLDINAVLSIAPAAEVVVYDAPFAGPHVSFQGLFNAMIDDGVDIISNSWAYCEDQTTLADVQSIEAILQTAAASGISVFSAAGDTGSTCLDGSPNTVAVPASSPSITAVGGTSRTWGPGFLYASESWWDGTSDTPPTGQGGFGITRFFPRPAYQDGLNASPMRSVPDVAYNADPAIGALICHAAGGGCPTALLYGGTSVAAPLWAGFTALLNQAHGSNLGNLNELLYSLAGTDAFHGPDELGSDFAHVGLGSPNLNLLSLLLNGETVGPVDAAESSVKAYISHTPLTPVPGPTVAADGLDAASVVVWLRDANGNLVSGKTVALQASSANVTIAPPSAVTDVASGAVVFTVTTLTPETVTFTATDTTDGIELTDHPDVVFAVPSAASAGIDAFPTTVAADGVSTTTIAVTLQDVLGRPTPGKEVQLSQGGGHSIISGPIPPVTDANGEIEFTAANLVNETVTYTAVDVTDGNLPVPGSVEVMFQGGAAGACGSAAPPVGANGYAVTPFATGFDAGPFSFGGVNFNGCPGAALPAFLEGDVFLSNSRDGDLFKLGLDGGAATNALANHGPTLGVETVGADGRLYATRVATTGNFTTGAILELDPETGAALRTVASNLRCPHSLVVDPLSGDLFYDDFCFGAGSDDPAIHRVRDPASANPTVEVYATLPRTPNGRMAFAPDGTLYAVTGYIDPEPAVVRVSGTDGPTPPTIETIPGVHSFFWVNVVETAPDGSARSLLLLTLDGLELVDITTDPPASTVVAEGVGGGTIGPDGCLYSTLGHTVFKLTDPMGGCSFLSTAASPSLGLTPAAVSPDPAQGTSQTFTAAFQNIDVPEGTAVFFQVSGANPSVRMTRTDAAGQATFAYTAAFPGDDVIVATASVEDDTLTSNQARVTWDPGQHVTFLTLNPSPRAGAPGETVVVRASLTDSSVEPPAPLEGMTIDFALRDAECSGVTDASGLAECELTAGAAGTTTLAARFAGTPQLVESDDAIGFAVVADGPLGGPVGDFKCYVVRSKAGTPRFARIPGVHLADELETLVADVVREKNLCNPVVIDDAPVLDSATHLACYTLRPVPGQRGVTPPNRTIQNRFGEQTIRFLGSSNDRTLCVPAEAHLEGTEPAEASFGLESFRCRRVKSVDPAKLTPAPELVLEDEVEGKLMRVRALRSLCTPVAIDGEEAPASETQLACYTLSQAPRQEALRRPGTIEMTNELAEQSLTLRNAQRLLCVPTRTS